MINNIVYFPALYAGYLFYETLTRDIRDDSDFKNTASQIKDGAKVVQKREPTKKVNSQISRNLTFSIL